jgi:hypothetical protein
MLNVGCQGNPNKKPRNPNNKEIEILVWISGFFVWVSNFPLNVVAYLGPP